MIRTRTTKGYNKWEAVSKLIVLFLLFSFTLPLTSAHSEGLIVREVEYVGLTRIDEEEMRDIMSISLNDVFDAKALGEGIKRAFRKGVFRDVRVESEAYEEGLKLRFVLEEIPLISKVIINGNKHLSSGRIKDIIPFREEENFIEELMVPAESDLLDFYNRKGFADARVEIISRATGEG